MNQSIVNVPENGWEVQPEAFHLIRQVIDRACLDCPWLDQLRQRMLSETGTRLIDWIDHLAVPPHYLDPNQDSGFDVMERQLTACDFERTTVPAPVGGRWISEGQAEEYWIHRQGLFPKIATDRDVTQLRLVIKVDSIEDFATAHRLNEVVIQGRAGGRMQKALVIDNGTLEIHVVRRSGWPLWRLPDDSDQAIAAAAHHLQRFRSRSRSYDQDVAFTETQRRLEAAVKDLGQDWSCALHFEAERVYWQFRNHAARVQKRRQDELGLGWANHDHHTYRCSREYFSRLVSCLETIGMQCRERFYAGEQAGWGAQVLEQPVVGIVVFADVDLRPEELSGDFAHQGLPADSNLGTVGLWCLLHGDSLAAAGLHHLECQFDFQAARQQLEAEGVSSMKPFTDFEHLKQSFTKGEIWPVDPQRLQLAVSQNAISPEQAETIAMNGAIGSHLEVLERNDGFKGFNQTGISDIISKTDPRKSLAADREDS